MAANPAKTTCACPPARSPGPHPGRPSRAGARRDSRGCCARSPLPAAASTAGRGRASRASRAKRRARVPISPASRNSSKRAGACSSQTGARAATRWTRSLASARASPVWRGARSRSSADAGCSSTNASFDAALLEPAANAVRGYAAAPMISAVARLKLAAHREAVAALGRLHRADRPGKRLIAPGRSRVRTSGTAGPGPPRRARTLTRASRRSARRCGSTVPLRSSCRLL